MANEIKTNPLIEKAIAVRKAAAKEALPPIEKVQNRNTPKAALNYIPDSDSLTGLIDKALTALSRGVRWARGSILNLLV